MKALTRKGDESAPLHLSQLFFVLHITYKKIPLGPIARMTLNLLDSFSDCLLANARVLPTVVLRTYDHVFEQ